MSVLVMPERTIASAIPAVLIITVANWYAPPRLCDTYKLRVPEPSQTDARHLMSFG